MQSTQRHLAAFLLAMAGATGAGAQTLDLPFPVISLTTGASNYDSYALPVAPWAGDHLPVRMVEGMVLRRAWQLDAPTASLLAVIAPLRDQLRAQGYTILLDCKAADCGGFDFRFATEVMDEPAMHVDLGEFRFLSAEKGGEAVGILVSRSAAAVFVQAITVTPGKGAAAGQSGDTESGTIGGRSDAGGGEAPGTGGLRALPPLPNGEAGGKTGAADTAAATLASRLDEGYAAVLEGLDFESGSAVLTDGDHAAAAALAAWLAADPARHILLVGHTDASGTLDANIALSKRRAESVRQILVRQFGTDGSRIEAVGAGPMAPRDTNATDWGRLHNRRVEAVPLVP